MCLYVYVTILKKTQHKNISLVFLFVCSTFMLKMTVIISHRLPIKSFNVDLCVHLCIVYFALFATLMKVYDKLFNVCTATFISPMEMRIAFVLFKLLKTEDFLHVVTKVNIFTQKYSFT